MLADLRLCSRGNDRLRELLVLLHALWQFHATDLTYTALVSAPCATTEVTTYDHLHRETLALYTYGHHRIGSRQFPVGANIGGRIEELRCDLAQHLAFVGDALRQDHVKRRDAVGGYHDQYFVVDVIDIAYFPVIHTFLSGKMEVSFN